MGGKRIAAEATRSQPLSWGLFFSYFLPLASDL